jgi:hypothetical protein
MSQAGGGLRRAGVRVFDELVATSDGTLAHLVPEAIRQALGDPTVRETLQVFVEADLNVPATAQVLSRHPGADRGKPGATREPGGYRRVSRSPGSRLTP